MKRLLLFLIIISLSLVTGFGQSQSNSVRVNLTITGPYSTNIMDYAPSQNNRLGKMIVTVQNLTRIEQNIYLRGDIRGTQNGVRIFTDADYNPTQGITLAPLETRQLFSHEIMDLYDPNHLTYIGTSQEEIKRTRHVPEGEYSLCVRAYDFTAGRRNMALSPEQPLGCFTVFMRNVEPPILIQPQADAEVKALDIQNVVFSWTVSAGSPPGTTYRLKIVEIFDPKRNPNDAFLSSTTPPIFEKDLLSPVYVYGPADVPLVPGRKYAWAVSVVDSRGQTSFQNQGRSEVRAFTYKQNTTTPIISTIDPKPKKADKTLVTDVKFTANLNIMPLNRNTFKGKLVWAYRKSETAKLTYFEPITTYQNVEIPALAGNTGGKNQLYTALEKPLVTGNKSGSNTNSAGGKISPAYMVMGGGVSSVLVQNLQTQAAVRLNSRLAKQNRINSITGDKKNPLINTKVRLHLRPKTPLASQYTELLDIYSDPNTIFGGESHTDENGNFSINFNDKIPDGYEASITVSNPNFEFASYEVALKKNQDGIYDLGEMLGVAKTFRLKVSIINDDGMNLDAATFKIVRSKNYYNGTNINQSTEVLKEDSTFSEPEIVAQGVAKGFYSRLFFSHGTSDIYTIIIEGEGIKKTNYTISFKDILCSGTTFADYDNVPILDKKYKPQVALPVVEGRVVTRNGEIPVIGASVRIRKKGSNTGESVYKDGKIITMLGLNDRIGKTDSAGRFKIENIPVSSEPYEIYVRYKDKGTVHDQDLYLSQKGLRETVDPVFVNAELITVLGKVVDIAGETLPDATLTWKTGGNPFYSDDEGNFKGSNVEGKHILIARKPGFKDTEYAIELKASSKTSGAANSTFPLNTSIQSWNTAINSNLTNFTGTGTYNGKVVSPKPSPFKNKTPVQSTIDYTLSTTALGYFEVFKDGFASNEVSSGHVIVLSRFYVKALVKDYSTGHPIENAKVSAEFSQNHVLTNALGQAVVEDVAGGNAAIVTSGPEGSFYTTVKSEILVDMSKDTATVEVKLKAGSGAQGTVKQNGSPVANAEISVEGLEFITTTTDAEGRYTLKGIPLGEYTLVASKGGLLGDTKTQNFEANQNKTIDFNLTDPGFNASQLLGFKMVLQKSRPGTAANEFIISGELRDLPENPMFKIEGGSNFRLKFSEKTIIKNGDKIYPKGGELITDASEVKLKAYEYLVVKHKSSGGLKIRAMAGSNNEHGELVGEALIDIVGSFSSLTGLSLPSEGLSLTSGNAAVIAPINSKGELNGSALNLKTSPEGWKIFGIRFVPDLTKSGLDKNGINLSGKIRLENIPLLNNQEFQLKTLTITKRGELKNVEVNMSPQPVLTIVNWKLKISGLKLNQYGIKFSGNLDVPIPSSETVTIGVKDLGINNNLLTGGTFSIPSAGINIFNVISFKTTAGRDFTFQKMAGTNHYRFIGSGKITFSQTDWLKSGIELDNFSLATNGEFSVIAKTGIEVDFANMAKLGITKFGFNSSTSTITVGGKFKLDIPMFGAGAEGTLHFQKGKAPRLDELGINFNLASAIALEAKLAFNKNEFRGKGGLKLAGLTGVELEFWYQKLANGKRIGANFMAYAVIPIGVVNLSSLQGGFDFNTSDNIYSIRAGGKITLGVDPAGVVALNPVEVKITSTPQGPIFEGGAKVQIMNSWNIGDAKMVLNFGQKRFYIDGSFGAGITLMKGVKVESRNDLFIELFTGQDWHWIVSGATVTDIAGIFNSNVTLAGGWNIPRSAHSAMSGIPDYVLTNGRLYGGFFKTSTSIKIPRTTVGIKNIAGITVWYNNSGSCEVYANFKQAAYGFKIASNWSAGGNVEFLGFDIASLDMGLSGLLEGYYSSGDWGLDGRLSGHARGKIGCNSNCNSIGKAIFVPCGFRICASASVGVKLTNKNLSFSVRLGE